MEFLKIIPVGLAGVLSFLYGEWSGMLSILVAFVLIDYVTGIISAYVNGELKSKIGMVGIARKVFIFTMVAVAHLVDQLLIENGIESGQTVMTMTIVFYALNEFLSITENAGRIGLPVPEQIKNAIMVLKKPK